jgi:hypothetical protein
LQLYADGGYQLRIRRLEGTPNYGPRQMVKENEKASKRRKSTPEPKAAASKKWKAECRRYPRQ